jgi:2-oxoglutarate dehydrogenase E1 component
MDRFSFLNAAHAQFFSDLYDQYTQNPDGVEPSWRAFFQGFDFANEFNDNNNTIVDYANNNCEDIVGKIEKEFNVIKLIEGYRSRGHLFTKTNPVRDRRSYDPNLSIENFGLNQADLEIIFD